MNSSSVEHLMLDHRGGEKVLGELESLLNERPTQGCWSEAHSANFRRLTQFFENVVLGHIRKEEEVLFPVLEAYLPRDIGPLAVLRGEHREICSQFERFQAAGQQLSTGSEDGRVCEDFERTGRAMLQIFRDHVYKEDRVLFPMVARFLTPERDAHLLQQMREMDARKGDAPAQPLAAEGPA